MRKLFRWTRKLQIAYSLALIAALVFSGTALAAAVVVDPFDTPSQTVLATSAAPSGLDVRSHASILGGGRDVIVHWYAGSNVFVRIDNVNSNLLEYTSESSTRGDAYVQWDGSAETTATLDPDGMCSSVNCPAGTGRDLTGGGTNDGFHFEVPFNDIPIAVRIRIWSSSDLTAYDEYNLTLPGGILTGYHVDFFMPFSGFTAVNGGADETNAGAVELFINGNTAQSAGADVSLNFLEADSSREFGDAPAAYGIPSHVPDGVRLGDNSDIEPAALTSGVNADGDDVDQAPPDDEDGVTRTPGVFWAVGTDTGSLDVVVKGCPGTCYLNGWIDWDNDNSFDPGDQIITDMPVTTANYIGVLAMKVDVPASYTNSNSYFARFRICPAPGACNNPGTSNVAGGEVEDYKWSFGATAIELTSLDAAAANNNLLAFGAMVLLLVASAGIYLVRKRSF